MGPNESCSQPAGPRRGRRFAEDVVGGWETHGGTHDWAESCRELAAGDKEVPPDNHGVPAAEAEGVPRKRSHSR